MRNDRGVKLLAFHRRRTAKLTCGDLGVLGGDSVYDVDRRQLIVIQLMRVHPDTHRILRAKQLGIANAGGAADGILDVGRDEVGDIVLRHAAVLTHEAGDHQEAAGRFLYLDTLLLHFLRQQRHRQLQFILHLHLGDIGVSAGLERERQLQRAGRITVRGHIHQSVDTVHILLDNLRDRILQRFRIGAGVVCTNLYRYRSNIGILLNRQLKNR